MTTINTLITSVGVTTATTIIKALKTQKEVPIRIIATDMDPLASGLYLNDCRYVVPPATEPEFIPTILEICDKEMIDLIIPLYSSEIPIFALNKKEFESRDIGLIVPSYRNVLTCIDKLRFYEFLSSVDLPSPKTYLANEIEKLQKYPLFMKPRRGSSTKDAFKVYNKKQLNFHLNRDVSFVIQEYVEGQEYTTDVICDYNSQLLAYVIRERLTVKGGLAIKCRTVKNEKLALLVRELVQKIGIIGPANVQAIITPQDEIKFIEVNPRFAAGGLPLSIQAGVNFPLLALKLFLGQEIKTPDYEENLYMIRYWTELFLKGEELCLKK
ncbi:MAG: ATP-grasp domain-containing protein [Candidatus Hodarchaeota archaeon]